MPFEMSCATCDGRLMVETLGIVVACPHCGTHLAIPAEIPGLTPSPELQESIEDTDNNHNSEEEGLVGSKTTWFAGDDSSTSISDFPGLSGVSGEPSGSESNILVSEPEVQAESEVPSALRVLNPDPSTVLPAIVTDVKVSEPISHFPLLDAKPETPDAAEAHVEEEHPVPELDGLPNLSAEEPAEFAGKFPVIDGTSAGSVSDSGPNIVTEDSDSQESAEVGAIAAIVSNTAAEKPASQESPASPRPVKAEQKEPARQSAYDSVYSSRRGKLVPNAVFQVWLSYTILMTAAVVMGIYYIFTAPVSNLESLPDVKPVEKNGKVVRHLVSEKAAMPWGHTLALNETQRFGNIEVTPLKVTRGDLTLVGRDYVEESRRLQHEGEVLKLWLKFKNVSDDQMIAPVDNDLLFYRDPRAGRKAGALANNFVCRASEKSEQGNLVLVYDHWFEGDYNIRDANIGTEIKPGEEVTVYIPTEPEGWNKLDGTLIWRVHVRKGYSPKNYGVTTIFEVEFDSGAIQPDSASA